MESTSGSSGNAIPVSTNMPASAPSAPASAPTPSDTSAAPPARDEDSGLHDIRNLASSARMRLSSRRLGTNPPPVDEDVLAASSGSWKAVALPEPAKMVSLPELETLPSKADIKAQIKAEKAAAKARKSRPSGEMLPAPVEAAPAAAPAEASLPSISAAASTPAVAEAPLHLEEDIPSLATGSAKGAVAPAMPMIGSRIAGAHAPKKSRAALYGALGVGLAAAAGVIIYVQTQKGSTSSADEELAADRAAEGVAASTPAAAPPAKPTVESIATADDQGADTADTAAAGSAEPEPAVEDVPAAAPEEAKPVKKAAPRHHVRKPQKHVLEVKDPGNGIAPKKKDEVKKPEAKGSNEPSESFDDLLKEAGYQKVEHKKKLAKKSLTGSDFKTGMDAIRAKARACYNGTQGLANIKLTIAPSGKVAKVAVTGPFAGTPVAGCVTAAVRGATFPAWDGGPQSFRYSFLLSE
jgi:hypothetical protein